MMPLIWVVESNKVLDSNNCDQPLSFSLSDSLGSLLDLCCWNSSGGSLLLNPYCWIPTTAPLQLALVTAKTEIMPRNGTRSMVGKENSDRVCGKDARIFFKI